MKDRDLGVLRPILLISIMGFFLAMEKMNAAQAWVSSKFRK